MPGTLYIVATPIGNLQDLSQRAAHTLAAVAAIACEDTRQTHKLLAHLGIEKPLLVFHDHNERDRTAALLARLQQGESLALVSDAGTPLISDPGYRIVDAAIEAGISVVPIPGPAAFVTALSASGLPTDAFYFGGFLAAKSGQRRKQLESVGSLEATLIFYEAPHRILESLEDLAALWPTRPIVLARELTKLHEEFLRGTPSELHATLADRPSIKGEFTVLIGKGALAPQPEETVPVHQEVARLEALGIPRMEAIKTVAKDRGLPKRTVYQLLEDARNL
ncbi:MAG: 16S rRNA (cytidine(1402)-2'-O)-methyltransferase [Acidobacteria bacterium]|nr:16S rRNA (cytidine(1402)-2'-O)-methyltransferase [Acidobacteriota bacterium]